MKRRTLEKEGGKTLKNNLLFKGGTSLSKAYNVIERFPEDVDITIKKIYLKLNQKKRIKFASLLMNL